MIVTEENDFYKYNPCTIQCMYHQKLRAVQQQGFHTQKKHTDCLTYQSHSETSAWLCPEKCQPSRCNFDCNHNPMQWRFAVHFQVEWWFLCDLPKWFSECICEPHTARTEGVLYKKRPHYSWKLRVHGFEMIWIRINDPRSLKAWMCIERTIEPLWAQIHCFFWRTTFWVIIDHLSWYRSP